jgi:hypothetical protein
MDKTPLSDADIYEAKQTCVELGECTASYHLVQLISEVERLKANLETATSLLKRIADKAEEGPTGDPQWWRDYFLFTGEHMILTDEGWEPGDAKASCVEDEIEIHDEINVPA